MALALLSSSVPFHSAGAAETSVQVRGGDHKGYTRIVFQGDHAPKYTVSQEGSQLILKFSEPVKLETQGESPDTLPRVEGYKILNDSEVEIDFSAGISVRHFAIDKRIIVDLRGAPSTDKPTKAPETKATEKAEPEKTEKPPVSAPVSLTKKIEKTETKVEDHPELSEEEKIARKIAQDPSMSNRIIVDDMKESTTAPEQQKKEAAPVLQPHTINVAGTTSFGMAAFEKGNRIWIVIDKPDVVIPPQIEGPDRDKFPEFQRIPAIDTTIFRMEKPNGYKLSGDGGGLIWKIDLTSSDAGDAGKYQPEPLVRLDNTGQSITGQDDGPSLAWPGKSLHRISRVNDPETGEKIWVGIVNNAQDFLGQPQRFSEFETLPSIVGFAVIGKVDDLSVEKNSDGAKITRLGGLALSQMKDILPYKNSAPEPEEEPSPSGEVEKIFDFSNWKNGDDYTSVTDNQRLILSGLLEQTDQKKTEGMIFLGRMMLSHGFAQEAEGYFDLAEQYTPELTQNTEFQALRGVASAMAGNFKESFDKLSNPVLENSNEIKIWKAYALSGLDDWQQAAKTLPSNLDVLEGYPAEIEFPVGLRVAEISLREGNKTKAEKTLKILEERIKPNTSIAYSSALMYLQGELNRQKGDLNKAKGLWSALEIGKDDLYRAKSKLALSMLRYGQKEITIDKAIYTLEGLRYAWRGDELETAINFNLGKLYLEEGNPIRALGLMRQASTLIPNSEQGKMISKVMHATFQDLYMTDKIQTLSPVDALTLYDEFADLVPKGAEGDRLARQLAERMADVDLLPRAINLLKQQVDTRLSGLEGASVAIRLAAMQVLDNKPKDALESLEKADIFLKGQPSEQADPKHRQIALLRAKSHAQMGDIQKSFAALSLLSQDEDVLRLRADIAWKAKKWQDAADALEQLVAKQDISLTRPLSDVQAKLIMDWAVALYLADNRYVLANLRERYGDSMSQTSKAREFEVVTRPRQNILLADRDTINNIIGETDMFKDFLESLREDLTGPVKETTEPPTRPQVGKKTTAPANIPEQLKNAPQIKTDEVLAD
ncbi:MAG: hypothetical protein AUJ12_02690 [Alphaproteobacteria bacterium CG1_02_46_17]|nr:MAG: hypothetical protein AUJ12_02690 [Alphaproteobacteria bacterium CG1_02_46_17]